MNGREALKALADGKRVRATCWPSEAEFIYLDPDSALILDEKRDVLREPISWDGDWEIVEEPATDDRRIASLEAKFASIGKDMLEMLALCEHKDNRIAELEAQAQQVADVVVAVQRQADARIAELEAQVASHPQGPFGDGGMGAHLQEKMAERIAELEAQLAKVRDYVHTWLPREHERPLLEIIDADPAEQDALSAGGARVPASGDNFDALLARSSVGAGLRAMRDDPEAELARGDAELTPEVMEILRRASGPAPWVEKLASQWSEKATRANTPAVACNAYWNCARELRERARQP